MVGTSRDRVWVNTYFLDGADATPTVVEASLGDGFPEDLTGFGLQGLPDQTAEEVEYRTMGAIAAQGFGSDLGGRRVCVRVATPPNYRTGRGWGAGLELPIAMAVLLVLNPDHISEDLQSVSIVGGITPDGRVYPTRGLAVIAGAAGVDRQAALVLPRRALDIASVVGEVPPLRGVASLSEAVWALRDAGRDDRLPVSETVQVVTERGRLDVAGQEDAAAALTTAVSSGRRSVLLLGGAGVGKTRLAGGARAILPPMSDDDVAAVTKMQTLAEPTAGVAFERPYRAPHPSIPRSALLGTYGRPGVVSEADRGILLLDDVTAFDAEALAGLDGALKQRRITFVPPADGKSPRPRTFAADALLIGTARHCPCGAHEPDGCVCNGEARRAHAERLARAMAMFEAVVELAPPPVGSRVARVTGRAG